MRLFYYKVLQSNYDVFIQKAYGYDIIDSNRLICTHSTLMCIFTILLLQVAFIILIRHMIVVEHGVIENNSVSICFDMVPVTPVAVDMSILLALVHQFLKLIK